MVDKKYCMSSYMAFRYIEDDDRDFYAGMHHENIRPFADSERIPVHSADFFIYTIWFRLIFKR